MKNIEHGVHWHTPGTQYRVTIIHVHGFLYLTVPRGILVPHQGR